MADRRLVLRFRFAVRVPAERAARACSAPRRASAIGRCCSRRCSPRTARRGRPRSRASACSPTASLVWQAKTAAASRSRCRPSIRSIRCRCCASPSPATARPRPCTGSSASSGATGACPTCRSNGRSSSRDLRLPDARAPHRRPGGQGRAAPQHRRGDRARRVRRAHARGRRRALLGRRRDADGRGLSSRRARAGPIPSTSASRRFPSARVRARKRPAPRSAKKNAARNRDRAATPRSRRRPECRASRLIARAVASASSSVAPRQVTCPILRARRGSALPYRCSFACGWRSTSRPRRARAARPRGAGEPEVAQQVHHHRRRVLARVAQRQVGQHARLLLELRRDARVDRVVAAVVRPRRDLVDEQRAVARDEHLDAQHAAVVERVRDAGRDLARAAPASSGDDARGHDRHVEDAVAMPVLGDRPGRGLAALVARDDHRHLAGERRSRCSSTHGCAAHRAPRRDAPRRACARAPGPCRRSRSARS